MGAIDVIVQIVLVFAPHVGYVAQYLEISNTNSFEGYAPLVSLILLTSNTLRLYYRIGKSYLLALFFQALLGALVHFVLLMKVLDVHVKQVVSGHQNDALFGSAGIAAQPLGAPISIDDAGAKPAPSVAEAQAAFNSPTSNQGETVLADEMDSSDSPVKAAFYRFLRFLFQVEDSIEQSLLRLTPRNFAITFATSATVMLVLCILYYISIGRLWTGAPSVIGYLSLGIEALLVVPQILRNARRRSTEGLTIVLILTWVIGDISKVIYYGIKKQALPFILCGVFQILLDVVVVGQVVYYRFYLRRDGAAASQPVPL